MLPTMQTGEAAAVQVERVQKGGELPPWYDLSEWDESGDTPAAESHSVSLQVPQTMLL